MWRRAGIRGGAGGFRLVEIPVIIRKIQAMNRQSIVASTRKKPNAPIKSSPTIHNAMPASAMNMAAYSPDCGKRRPQKIQNASSGPG